MTLPKAKTRKLIKREKFEENAKKVRESMKDQAKYLREKKSEYGNSPNSYNIFNFS